MDLVPKDDDENVVPHSADDSHQHYAQGHAGRARPTSRRVEVIIGEDRRRRWSPEDKAKITAASFVPGANISAVARQYGVSQGLLHYWRRCARESVSDAQEMRFVPVVKVDDEQPQRMRRLRPIDFSVATVMSIACGRSYELIGESRTSSL